MADIQTDLNTIATGKYGKDVRKAIHDAIETCYSDGRVGSVDLTARKQISQLVVSGNKELTEQTLWSGSIYGTGASLTLSSAIGNFDYLDIYVTKEGNTSIHTIPAVRSTYNIRESNLPDDGAAGFSISEVGINFPDTTTLAIYKQSYFARSSSGVDTGRIVNPTDTDSQSNLHIIKVIGRKSVANTEVTDIRNPADGMTEPTGGYSTAGDAVRGQISELKSQIESGGLTEDIKQALLACFEKVAWIDTTGQTLVDALEDALYPSAQLTSISAVYTQSGTVYTSDSLDSLKADLVVTAHYSDSTTSVVNNYALSGTLVEGTSTITVTYGGKTTTFNVTNVVEQWWDIEWNYEDGGLPNAVDSANWSEQANTTQKGVSFVTGEGIRVNHTSDAFMSYYPKNYETSSNSTFEVVFNITTMPTLNGIIIRHGNGSVGMQTTIGNNGVSIDNGSTQISGVNIATGTDYTVKSVCDTTGTCHLYLNGTEIWSGSASAIGNKKNYVMVTSKSSTDVYIREIRFGV